MVKKAVVVNTAKVIMLEKPSKLVELNAKEFSIDLKVQRTLNEARADAIADDFQPHALGMLTASKRADGHIYVLDGATRVSAARKCSYDGLMATRLFENLTLEEEAALFLATNNSRSVQAIDRFKVRITQKEPVAVGINNVLKVYNLHVDWASNDTLGVISAISAVEKIYKGAGVREEGQYPDLVDKVFRTLTRAYGERPDRAAFSRVMLEGLGIFVATFGSRIDYDRLVAVFQATTPRQIVAQTRTMRDAHIKGASLGGNAAAVLHRLYNHRHKAKLPAFNEVEPRNAAYHQDRLALDPAQTELDDLLAREHAKVS
jgi:hypothetical protein